ncbi:hypothetical protein, partial [Escherichia coli]|uniref:hypothetical protein n=1 Tax=Escherichia coli TaxID=562 RepID=UPI003F47C574
MIERYFSAPKTLQRLRTGLSGPHIDGFADALAQHGYALALHKAAEVRRRAHVARRTRRGVPVLCECVG